MEYPVIGFTEPVDKIEVYLGEYVSPQMEYFDSETGEWKPV